MTTTDDLIEDQPAPEAIRLTKNVIQRLLDQNGGYKNRTVSKGKNLREQRDYEIRDGVLYFRSRGKGSWADSRFDKQFVADDDQTRRFLRNNLHALNTDGIEKAVQPSQHSRSNPPTRSPTQPRRTVPKNTPAPTSMTTRTTTQKRTRSNLGSGAQIAFRVAVALAPHAKRLVVRITR